MTTTMVSGPAREACIWCEPLDPQTGTYKLSRSLAARPALIPSAGDSSPHPAAAGPDFQYNTFPFARP
ncbi:hypothetical protein EVAR_10084_1 [Eumeta japonica]|uniref:Uncharacterized protein n=1 Tax=Eumeta variegata TaxID=151549 RepID=A0A4C1TRB6_EUMVA|nr:hypothetical protein EVAR_10084_1 [Eumeta japonica]